MRWKFWQHDQISEIDYDYGRIADVSVAWELAHEEAANRIQARFEEERQQRMQRYLEEMEVLGDWLSSTPNYPDSTYTRTYEYEKRNPCPTIHKAQDEGRGYFYYTRCHLEYAHKSDHDFGEAKLVDELPGPKPIVVHELIGEIRSKADLDKLEEEFKEKDRQAKRLRKKKIKAIGTIAEIFDAEANDK